MTDSICCIATYVAMNDDDNSVAVENLGASPAELEWLDLVPVWDDPTMMHPAMLDSMQRNWAGHQGCPEMDMSNVFDIGRTV